MNKQLLMSALAVALAATALVIVQLKDDPVNDPNGSDRSPSRQLRTDSAELNLEGNPEAGHATRIRANESDGQSAGSDNPSTTQGEPPEEPDESGLTHTQKVERLRRLISNFESTPIDAPRPRQASAAYMVSQDAAINMLRMQGRAQYYLDVDDGNDRGFSMANDDPESQAIVAADNAKYTISFFEFPAFELARKASIAAQEAGTEPLFTADERLLILSFAQEALGLLESQ